MSSGAAAQGLPRVNSNRPGDVRVDFAALYCGPLEGFVARRTALVQQLRSTGDAGAVRVAKLRKPALSAWAIDQLAVENPGLLTELLAAATDAEDAQRVASGGAATSEALLVASTRVREGLAAAVRAATAVLDRAATLPARRRPGG